MIQILCLTWTTLMWVIIITLYMIDTVKWILRFIERRLQEKARQKSNEKTEKILENLLK